MNTYYNRTEMKIPIKHFLPIEQIEGGAWDQAMAVANHPAVKGFVAIMPDVHKGYGLPVGGVVALENAVSPYMCGVDIACGMLAYKLKGYSLEDFSENKIKQLTQITNIIKETIPVGFKHNDSLKDFDRTVTRDNVYKVYDVNNYEYFTDDEIFDVDKIINQLGTLGGGNHFIEIQYDSNKDIWFMIHSGSRNIGKRVCDKYHKIALELNRKYHSNIPNNETAFLAVDSNEGQEYIGKMKLCISFSYYNRIVMLEKVLKAWNSVFGSSHNTVNHDNIINIHHNFIKQENVFGKNLWVHRKGATEARKNLGIIPGSMGTKSFIVRGKNNEDSIFSCSHGAGRTMSRTKAKKTLSMDKFKEQMKDIAFDPTEATLDESPGAYKDIDNVMNNQTELVDIEYELKPLAVVKDETEKRH